MSDLFSRRLRAYRKLKHWTQNELADRMGVSVAIVGGLERGTRTATKPQIEILAALLQVSESELMGTEEEALD